MAQVFASDYFYGDESKEFSYFRIPRLLITHQRFKTYPSKRSCCMVCCLTAWDCPRNTTGTTRMAGCSFTTQSEGNADDLAADATRR